MSSSKAEGLDFRPLTFGKYKGKTPEQVAEIDPSYVCEARGIKIVIVNILRKVISSKVIRKEPSSDWIKGLVVTPARLLVRP